MGKIIIPEEFKTKKAVEDLQRQLEKMKVAAEEIKEDGYNAFVIIADDKNVNLFSTGMNTDAIAYAIAHVFADEPRIFHETMAAMHQAAVNTVE